ncbi:GyrI-like domain-containing protein [Herbiconiux ginsengi]|uniref:AraC family transcriptional regulator n=1 Tax=Herbiconiux ginsengi TaxID=381665 RepID=A0A1H3SYT4_9MICO|nr:GyrI-like domain-containing protein [Herbiconiux ginsengi]SDZ42741.1 AraC family transcriptional regulator [Herbiconiux ginsengi]
MTSITELIVPSVTVAGSRSWVPFTDLQAFFARALPVAQDALRSRGTVPAGAPIAVYFAATPDAVDVLAGFPVEPAAAHDETVQSVTLPAGRAVTAVHHGAYDDLGDTYDELHSWMTTHGLGEPGTMTEQYLVGPGSSSPPSEWQTVVTYYLPEDRVVAVPPAAAGAAG